MLRVVYFQVMKDFPTFKFASVGHYAKFAATLFGLTQELLSFFDSGNNAPVKIECAQPNPRFDMLLDVILKYMKQTPLTVLVDALQLEEVTDLSSANGRHRLLQNRYLKQLSTQEAAKRRALPGMWRQDVSSSPSSLSGCGAATIEKARVNIMLSRSIGCINLITRLVLQRELTSSFFSSSRTKNT